MLALLPLAYLGFASSVLAGIVTRDQKLPVVDLGYQRHQALNFNETGRYYNFSNIPYAEPPLGDLRFRAPVAPQSKSTKIDDGSTGRICPQGVPDWIFGGQLFISAYLQNQTFDPSTVPANATGPAFPSQITEDCLVLDVLTPEKVFINQNGTKLAPVMVWIHGGGYTLGWKGQFGNPATLLKASQINGDDGIVYVAINYRLGAFGYIAGPSLQMDGTGNAGQFDQLLALQWVQKYIHLFGGDKDQVTVVGESAGGGAVMQLLTAYGGLGERPAFKRAVPMSPGINPIATAYQAENTTDNFLSLLNVSSVSAARQLSSSSLMSANAAQVAASYYSTFTYGQAPDGSFLPGIPSRLLLQGEYHKNIQVMATHCSNEGLLFTPYTFQTASPTEAEAILKDLLLHVFVGISPEALDYIQNNLYPPVYDGSQPYTNAVDRVSLLLGEEILTSNSNALLNAYGPGSYSYDFNLEGGAHGTDLLYLFYNGESTVSRPDLAVQYQEYITSFVLTGKPTASGAPEWPEYGEGRNVLSIGYGGISTEKDGTENERTAWWRKALYA